MFDMYLQYSGMTIEQYKENMKDGAVKNVKIRLALEAIAKAEGLEISDDELNEEYKKFAERYQMEEDKIRELVPAEAPLLVPAWMGRRFSLMEELLRAVPICLRLLTQLTFLAFARALLSAGKSMPARIAMIAITTSSSIKVNCFFIFCLHCFNKFCFNLFANHKNLLLFHLSFDCFPNRLQQN